MSLPGVAIAAGVMGAGVPFAEAGQITYSTPGTYSFTVPNYQTGLVIELGGAGGGGAGVSKNSTYSGGVGGASTCSDLALSAGGGRSVVPRGESSRGTASGGDINTSGSNPSGKNGGNGAWPSLGSTVGKGGAGDEDSWTSGADETSHSNTGPGGGGGAYCKKTYARGEVTRGTILTIVVGAGGTAGANGGSAGLAGRAKISWT